MKLNYYYLGHIKSVFLANTQGFGHFEKVGAEYLVRNLNAEADGCFWSCYSIRCAINLWTG